MKSNLTTSFLSDTALRRSCPAAFAEHPAAHVSENYHFVPSTQIIDQMKTFEYFAIGTMSEKAKVKQAGATVKTLSSTGAHSITFEPKEQNLVGPKGIGRLQITMLNSHDTSRRLQLRAGIFRLVCANGLVAGASFASVNLTHLNSTMAGVDDAISKVIESTKKVEKLIGQMAKRQLTGKQQLKFAESAMTVRYGDESKWKIKPAQLLGVRRPEDDDASLWVVFNRIQENVLRGGLRSELTGFETVPVVSPVTNFATNASLWDVAESFLN